MTKWIPTFSGEAAWKGLFQQWGIPNAAPRDGDQVFARCRVLFVDDANDGAPVAYWIASREPTCAVTKPDRPA